MESCVVLFMMIRSCSLFLVSSCFIGMNGMSGVKCDIFLAVFFCSVVIVMCRVLL